MWTRKLLKTNAKHVLSRSYWQGFLACLIASLLCGTNALRYHVGSNRASILPQEAAQLASNQGFPYSLLLPYLFTLGTLAILLFLFAALCWTILVSPAIQVGLNRYLLFNRIAPARLGMLFSSFTYGYWNTVWVMFLLNLKIVLWSLLLIVPGIVKSYQYRFVGWLLAENPGMDASRAFEISTMMTDGEKWNIFVLDLSFLGDQGLVAGVVPLAEPSRHNVPEQSVAPLHPLLPGAEVPVEHPPPGPPLRRPAPAR